MGKIYMICGNVDMGRSVASTMANHENIVVITPEQAKKMPLNNDFPHAIELNKSPLIGNVLLSKPLSRKDRRKAGRLNK